ncbi:MAG TPA: hypothetical protein VFC84_07175 [Desulfosporosinus sp.]|nr:hypothetical protein [Desulfosporosinus sp.]
MIRDREAQKGRILMKVKIFSSPDSRILEKTITQWLEDNSWLKVVNITQSTGTATVISIWYNEPNVPILG